LYRPSEVKEYTSSAAVHLPQLAGREPEGIVEARDSKITMYSLQMIVALQTGMGKERLKLTRAADFRQRPRQPNVTS